MNLSKYIGKTFPAGKTAEELGIDTSRKFVLVDDINVYHPPLEGKQDSLRTWTTKRYYKGTIFTVEHANPKRDYATFYPAYFPHDERVDIDWLVLAYLEEEDDEKDDEANRIKNFRVHDKPLSSDEHTKEWIDGKSTTSEGWTVAVDDEKEYVPCEGDRVAMNGEVVKPFDENGVASVRFATGHGGFLTMQFDAKALKSLTLISRKPRTLTKEEATKLLSEKLGEDVTIE